MSKDRQMEKVYERVRLLRNYKYLEWVIKQLLNSTFVWCEYWIMQISEVVIHTQLDLRYPSRRTQAPSMIVDWADFMIGIN